MEMQHLNVKVFVKNPESLDVGKMNPVFQGWIQNRVTQDMLIDVADYLHVPEGPGMVLVGLEADYSMDHSDGRWGLRYNRKAPLDGNNQDKLRSAFQAVLSGCERLEKDDRLNGLKFDLQEFELTLNDRALAPNTDETWKQAEPEFKAFFDKVLGEGNFEFQPHQDRRARFGLQIKHSGSLTLEELIKKLEK